MNYKDKIEGIIAGIGSPYGEGATYNRLADYDRERDGKLSHLEDYDIEELTKDITSLLEQAQRDAVEGFVSWWEKQELGTSIHHNNVEEYLNQTKEDIKEKQ